MGDEKENPIVKKIRPYVEKYLEEHRDEINDQLVSMGTEALQPITDKVSEAVIAGVSKIIPMNFVTKKIIDVAVPKIVEKIVEKMVEKMVTKVTGSDQEAEDILNSSMETPTIPEAPMETPAAPVEIDSIGSNFAIDPPKPEEPVAPSFGQDILTFKQNTESFPVSLPSFETPAPSPAQSVPKHSFGAPAPSTGQAAASWSFGSMATPTGQTSVSRAFGAPSPSTGSSSSPFSFGAPAAPSTASPMFRAPAATVTKSATPPMFGAPVLADTKLPASPGFLASAATAANSPAPPVFTAPKPATARLFEKLIPKTDNPESPDASPSKPRFSLSLSNFSVADTQSPPPPTPIQSPSPPSIQNPGASVIKTSNTPFSPASSALPAPSAPSVAPSQPKAPAKSFTPGSSGPSNQSKGEHVSETTENAMRQITDAYETKRRARDQEELMEKQKETQKQQAREFEKQTLAKNFEGTHLSKVSSRLSPETLALLKKYKDEGK